MPLALALALAALLPESVQFVILRGGDPRRISKILKRISSDLAELNWRFPAPAAPQEQGMPVKRLFTEGRAVGTLLLWIPFFMNLLTLYFVVSWLPGLLDQAGMPVLSGVRITALFSFGGILGCLTEGALMNLLGPFLLLVVEFGLSAALIGSLGYSSFSFPLTAALAFVLGVCVTGAQAGINALAATFYPTSIRSTGLGWALGIGRVGSIGGPLMAGVLLSLGWGTQHIFLASVIPMLLAMLAVMLSNRLRGGGSVYAAEPGAETD
jgi:AAHS family 4-hydroxybenzoate transporter-like MFS transporter